MAEYIEREVVEKMLESAQIITDGEYAGYCMDDISIYRIPAADVAPVVHGRWEVSDTPCERFKCSECGGGCWYYDYQGDVAKSRYCPSCGAKMDKGATDGD